MKFTLNWLKKYLDTTTNLDLIIRKLNDIGLEVESVYNNGEVYGPFLVAEIIDAAQHPDADKLKVCKVNDGTDILQIVCGASNARKGIKVVLAPVGSIIPANGMVIKKSKIRGVESHGMLCSHEELLLKEGVADGIMELKNDAVVGKKFADYAGLNEVTIETSLTPNRGDCASVYGIARDLSAAGVGKLNRSNGHQPIEFDEDKNQLSIEDTENCLYFCLRKIEGVNNLGEISDKFIASCLGGIGYQSKSPLVDISNFSMLSLGRPNHIYDADKVTGAIVVRKSFQGERFKALDGKEYILPEGLTVIADAEKLLSIAGVIGGDSSKVDAKTKNILVEVANFSPEAVMIAGRALNIITDSRFRFERGVDYANTELFIYDITDLIVANCGGQPLKAVRCTSRREFCNKKINFDFTRLKKISGYDIPEHQAKDILLSLGFKIEDGQIEVPSWRFYDVKGEEDIIEEVLRIYGFSNIPLLDLPLRFSDLNAPDNTYSNLSSLMKMRHMDELISWSFCSQENAQLFSQNEDLIRIKNPITADLSTMRPSILASLLPIIQKNIDRGIENLGIFEIGNIYSNGYESKQTVNLSGIRSGLAVEKDVHSNRRMVDFFDVKDDVLYVLNELGVREENVQVTREVGVYYHPNKSACFKLGKKILAYCGELHPNIATKAGSKALFAFEIFLDFIPFIKSKKTNIKPISDFQAASRDFAFILRKGVEIADIVKSIRGLKIDELEGVKIFDIYEGQGIEDGFKSVAFSVRLQPDNKTFTDSEICAISSKIIDVIQDKLGGVLRN